MIATLLALALYLWREGVFESETEQIQKLTAAIIPDNSVVLDRNGQKIGEYYSFYHVEIPFNKIPKSMVDALLAIEDRKFFQHEGVNWTSIGRAFVSVATSGRLSQGGSTLTMQLVKNYLLTREKKVSRKLREIILAYYVEKNLSKERILELYLNTMYMGHGAYGVGAASFVYFGKPLDQLTIAEFALLAGLFQAPSAYDPHKNPMAALKRKNIVLDAMVAAKSLSHAELGSAKKQTLVFKPWTPINETIAPFFVSWIRGEVERLLGEDELVLNDRGYKISTTLDRTYQENANRAIASSATSLDTLTTQINTQINTRINAKLSARNSNKPGNKPNSKAQVKVPERIEAALLVTDPRTGAILSMVGGRNFRESQFNRVISAKRSPGSSFKPVVYSLAFDKGMTWADLVFVSPIDVRGFRPKNHKGDDMTEVTMIKALAKSMNTPVVSLAQKFGIKNVMERAEAMGVTAQLKMETGIAIGGFSASMMDVDAIYRTIANDGLRTETFAITKIQDRDGKTLYEYDASKSMPVQAISAETAHLLRSGLQAVLTSGTATAVAHMAGFAAGKTGTSDDSRDNWFVGFTRDIVATTWVGGDQNTSLGDAASGASLALPIWQEFMSGSIGTGLSTNPWPTPEGMTMVTIDPDYGTPSDQGIPALFPNQKIPRKSQAAADMKTLREDKGSYRELKLGE
jgi:penicillin-binding protein 1A